MALTPGGTPYVESSDLVADYPTVSLALAEHIDTIGGKILQILSISKTDVFTTSSTSFVDVTGLDVSITPTSATSKILVLSDIFISNNGLSGLRHTFARIVRDSTAISVGTSVGSRVPVSTAFFATTDARLQMSASTIFLDSPATTSAVVYKVQILAGGNTAVLNRWGEDNDNTNYPRAASNITVMEVAA
jgi:hypothetical protein